MSFNEEIDAENDSNENFGIKTRSAFLWVASTSAIWQILSWILTLITARILTPKDFGIAALPGTVVPYLALIASMHLGTWIVQTTIWNEERAKAITTLSFILGALSTVVAFIAAPFLAKFYNDPELTLMFQVCAFIFVINNLGLVPEAKLHRSMEFKTLSLINMGVHIGQGLLTLSLALLDFGYWSLIIGIMASHIGRTISIIAIQGIYLAPKIDRSLFKEALLFGITAASASALLTVYSTVDDIVVGRLFGTTELGFYTMAFFFAQLPLSKLNMIISPVLTPYYSGLKNRGLELATPFLKTSRAIFSLTAPALTGLFIVAPEAITVVLGEQWLKMVPILRVLAIAALLQSITLAAAPLFHSLGKPGLIVKHNGFSSIVMPLGFIAGGYLYGLPGVYYAWIIGYPFVLGYVLWQLKSTLQLSPLQSVLNLKAPLTSATFMGIAVFFIKSNLSELLPLTLLIICAVSGIIIYSSLMFTLFKESSMEILRTKQELKSE